MSVHGLVQQGGTARTSTVVPHTVTGVHFRKSLQHHEAPEWV